MESGQFLLLCPFYIFLSPVGPIPGPSHYAVPVSAKRFSEFFESAKLAYSLGSAFAVGVNIGLCNIKRFCIFRFRSCHFHAKTLLHSIIQYIAKNYHIIKQKI